MFPANNSVQAVRTGHYKNVVIRCRTNPEEAKKKWRISIALDEEIEGHM